MDYLDIVVLPVVVELIPVVVVVVGLGVVIAILEGDT